MSETANPFDRFDGYVPEGEVVTPGPRPGFIERFQNNYDQGFYSGTVSGAVQGAYDQREEKRQTAARFEAMPQWETPLEGLAALGGQLAGAASSFENYIPLTWGAKAVGWTGIKMPQVAARFFAGAIDAGTVNAAVDTAVQGIEIGQGQRDSFSPGQLAASTALGAVAGGTFNAGFGARAPAAAPEPAPIAPEPAPKPAPVAAPLTMGGTATAEFAPPPMPVTMAPPTIGETLDATARSRRNLGPSTVTPPPAQPVIGNAADAAAVAARPGQAAGTFMFDARQLEVDANRFQFKSGGDAKGVTDTLRNVKRWIPERGNQLIVWQDAAGRNFVVDGHQRTGLARRLLDQGLENDIQIPGVLFREADGFTPENVMTIAALKNIAEGSASPIDGAKIIRLAGRQALADMPLSKDAVRTAADLALLSDDAFGMVVNEVVDAAHAKYVGRFIPADPARQKAAMDALAKADPANEDEAAVLVRRVAEAELVKAENGAQGDMFGTGAESTAIEEVKIVAGAIRALRSDAKLFARVFREADRIESAGSMVARQESQDAARRAELAALMVEKEAFRAGPLRDRLKQLAIEVKNDRQSLGQARTAFLDELSRTDFRPDQVRADAGGGSGGGEPAAPAARDTAEPGADGKPQTVLTGAERISDAELARRRTAEPLRPQAAQKLTMEDGLFGDGSKQPDFLSAAAGLHTGSITRQPMGIGGMAANPGFTRLQDIAERLGEALNVVAVRQGRLSAKVGGKTAAGQYGTRSGVIRLKKADDYDVFAHELGHHVEAAMGKPLKQLMAQHASELTPMAYQGADPRMLVEEGFAEYMRMFATNPLYAAREAPAFDKAFRAYLAADAPDALKAIEEAAAAWRAWNEQPSADVVAATVVTGKEPGWFAKARADMAMHGLAGTIAQRLHGIYETRFDTIHPMTRAVRELARIYKRNTGGKLLELRDFDNPMKLIRTARMAHGAGHRDVLEGVSPYRAFTPQGPNLRDALVTALGKPNVLSGWDDAAFRRFGAYLWSRRALGEWDRFDQGLIPNPPDKLTRGDHAMNVAEAEKAFPGFKAAADMVYEWNRLLWTKKRDAGLITHEQWEEGLKIRDYVPGVRAFDAAGDAAPGGGGKGSLKSGIVKRFRGSRRDVINPFETLVQDAYHTAEAIARNDAIKFLDRLALQAGPGGGAIAERIPSHRMKATMVDAIEAVEAAAKQEGMAKADIVALRDLLEGLLGDEKAAIFRPAMINEQGEPIVFFRDGGELKALRLADGDFGRQMMTVLSGMTPPVKDMFLETFVKTAAIGRLGVVTDPVFMVKNAIRDMVQSILFYGKPFERVANTFRGAADEALQREAARQYAAAGGVMGGVYTQTAGELRWGRDMNALRVMGWRAGQFTTVDGFLQATEFSESAMRFGLFRTFFDEAKGRGLDDNAAIFEAAYRARDHADFSRHGSRMVTLGRLIPFFRASLVGVDKFARQTVVPLLREPLTAEDARARAMAMKSWAMIGGAVLAWLPIHAMMADDEYYREAHAQRARNFVFRYGDSYITIPKPYDLAVFFNSAEAIWDAFMLQDPRAAAQWVEALRTTAMPPDMLQGNPLMKTLIEMRTGKDMFTGNDIVPEDIAGLEPFAQATERTSALATAIGEAINKPPVWVDQLILNGFTSMGRAALSLYDYAASDKPMPGWDDTVITMGFIKDASRGATSSRAFWDMVGERNGSLATARRTYDALANSGDAAAAAEFLAGQDATTRNWIAAGTVDMAARRIHPFQRARDAVAAISKLRRDLASPEIDTATGPVTLGRIDRGAADDILSQLQFAEARNALVMMQVPGWQDRELIETAGFFRELAAAQPDVGRALADRLATARVLPLDTVERLWPEFEQRLARDGSAAMVADLAAQAKGAGFEANGQAIKRKQRAAVPGEAVAPAP
jgi:hypothetical protein